MLNLTSKQRAHLKSIAHDITPIFQVGKNGVTPDLTTGIDEALEAREIVKISILQNCILNAQDICQTISERTKSTPVQIIGKRIVLYRPHKTNPKITLPKA
ncbi:RNA-binding protein [Candidatus Epulonipiscium fishelsonii]|uniref:RNA-binding protein n=1 Tax=Candidatus Epulonipiscium fishelsonii TaxID=77094 RepID=A0ACC8X9W4_9FIRM|nr:RNA-binding protein [Epulopiscium sp. SCG-B11WGA-EpuloA1]ONI41721.1 RNA-binding protein [Epulopiscium sp. SCG-B05WGA-EpuloA1]